MSHEVESGFGRRGPIVDRIGLSANYALILLTVPTFGVAALVGLASVYFGNRPDDRMGLSHFEYQKRTFIIAAASIVVGGMLVVVNVGVFVLFAMLVWVLYRGAKGLRALQQGQVIANPLGLF